MLAIGRSKMGLVISLAACLAASGCAVDPNQLQPLFGKVLFKGQPLSQGTITFFAGDEPARRLAGGILLNGVFDIPADRGLLPGIYRVEISSPETPPNAEMVGGFPVNRERIPLAFNKDSKLTVEVKPGGGNRFEFTIP